MGITRTRSALFPLIFFFASVLNSSALGLQIDGYDIPPRTLSDFGSYPNPLGWTDDDRAEFHPVMKFPMIEAENGSNVPNIKILDFTVRNEIRQLATVQEQNEARRDGAADRLLRDAKERNQVVGHEFAVGRYDEDRVGLYESDLFDDLENQIDGYAGRRTIHMGIDLDGPLGTNVYSFWKGTILHVGYNAELGDYGNVIVIRHEFHPLHADDGDIDKPRVVYALYGHLNDAAIRGRQEGDAIERGELLGQVGDIHENGGWFIPHVHFQLSLQPPETHDMPGAVSKDDRDRAIVDYPDPRYVLGPLY